VCLARQSYYKPRFKCAFQINLVRATEDTSCYSLAVDFILKFKLIPHVKTLFFFRITYFHVNVKLFKTQIYSALLLRGNMVLFK